MSDEAEDLARALEPILDYYLGEKLPDGDFQELLELVSAAAIKHLSAQGDGT